MYNEEHNQQRKQNQGQENDHGCLIHKAESDYYCSEHPQKDRSGDTDAENQDFPKNIFEFFISAAAKCRQASDKGK